MKRIILFFALSLLIFAQIPRQISWQGIVADDDGNLLDGSYDITLNIYNVQTGGTSLWTESQTIEISNGYANIILGATNPLDIPFDEQYWLELIIREGEALNRIPLYAVPYALSSNETDPTWSGDANTTSAIYRTGEVGIGTDTPTALLHTNGVGESEGNILFEGNFKFFDPGDPPSTGAGTRMMWYPDKAAFRAGSISGSEWDKENIGFHSTAFGRNTEASGDYSTAWGLYSNASGESSTALGFYSSANGNYSIACGYHTEAPSYSETVFGNFNTVYSPVAYAYWDINDRLFVIGNGTSSSERSNALTLMKSGNLGLGTETPTALLHTYGVGESEGNILFEGEYKSTNPGDPPASGGGTRMMWYPDKASFRAGFNSGVWSEWDKENIGNFSTAFGRDTKASGENSMAWGYGTEAT